MKGSTLDKNVTRRHALSTAALAGVGAAVAACSSGTGTTTGTAADPAANGKPATGGEAAGAGEANKAPAGTLAKKADIPVGGGVIVNAEKVVVVQPEAGTFKAYSAICTHEGCPVKRVRDGVIVCPCHNSSFSIADGSPKSGPAKKALAEVAISSEGDTITLA
ncbi:Rieske (2Fe-2S) protein [Microtetraspora sp. AC03309]|uniref:Rieske (2Fe-2S) protein n=1 Tax=Microtetraspora sp. AC03309 TaxID=2779376 RepID=UPI001E41B124|nr:Rieske (2Fe-2S) protein [Microtetraspora sp. AC03309]MCC5581972.1 Rieske (2Fe-2S) protein [Microtetraspora sp. AC03309]